MRVVFFGSPPFAVPIFERLLESTHEVAALVTRPDRRRGRGLKVTTSPLVDAAREQGVRVLQPQTTKDAGFLDELRALPRFGLEVFINELWLDEELRIAIVDWPGVESPFKHTKRGGWLAGIRADISMLGDIFRTVSPAETLRQVFALRARRI